MNESGIQLSPRFVFIFERFFFLYWIVTVPFYIILVYFMIRAQMKKVTHLTSSFYVLCISTGVIDIVTLINNYFGAVFPQWGWLENVYLALGKPYLYVYFIITWSTGIMQAVSTSLLATNRLSAILFPHCHHQLWSGRRLKLAVAIQVIPGFIASLHILTNEVSLARTSRGGLVPKIMNSHATTFYFTVAAAFLTANSLLSIVAYCYAFCLLRKRNETLWKSVSNSKAHKEKRMKLMRKREYRLLYMASWIASCFTVAVQLLLVLYIYAKAFIFPIFNLSTSLFYTFYSALGVLYAGIGAYLLWIFSDALRHYICIRLGMRKYVAQSAHSSIAFINVH